MPEGDTIFQVATALRPRLVGETLRRVLLARQSGAQELEGRRVEAVTAKGKHLFIELEGGITLRSHLGLYGSWHRYPHGESWLKPARWASIVLETGREVFVCFHAREVELMRSAGLRRGDLLRRLGPDLVGPEVAVDEVLARAREFLDPEAPLVDVLLDQRPACGIGNIYKSEVLFLAGVDPHTPLGEVSDVVLGRLYTLARELLRRNLDGGPRVTRIAAEGPRLWVYGRRGRPCLRCASLIRRVRSGRDLRSTYWCPRCQPPHPAPAAGEAPD